MTRSETTRLGGLEHLASHAHPAELAARVGVGRTAVYKHWPSREELWADLIEFTLRAGDWNRVDHLELPADPVWESTVDLESPEMLAVFREQLNTTSRSATADGSWVLRAAALAYPEPAEIAAVRRAVDGRRIGLLARRAALGANSGRRRFTNPQFGLHQLAAASWAILDSRALVGHMWPERRHEGVVVDDGAGPVEWLLPAWAYRAFLFGSTVVDESSELLSWELAAVDDDLLVAPDWTPAQTQILAAGYETIMELFTDTDAERPLGVLPHITVERIARACRVSRRAVYSIWESRDSLIVDLLHELLTLEHERFTEQLFNASRAVSSVNGQQAGAILSSYNDRSETVLNAVSAYIPQALRPDVNAAFALWRSKTVSTIAEHMSASAMVPQVVSVEQAAELVLDLGSGLRRLERTGVPLYGDDIVSTFQGAIAAFLTYQPT